MAGSVVNVCTEICCELENAAISAARLETTDWMVSFLVLCFPAVVKAGSHTTC